MLNTNARYEVKHGQLFVNGEAIPLRRGMLSVALQRAGRDDHDGLLPRSLVADVLSLDRRVSLIALAAETASVA